MRSGAGTVETEKRLRILLPETYKAFDDDEVQPVSMGSAGLKYDLDGNVLWHEMWGSFCDLAMAGGPPHRGALLAPSCAGQAEMQTPHYRSVSAEICRGVTLVTGLYGEQAPACGWVRVYCPGAAMAGWLMRAIVMENVSASAQGLVLSLPCASSFRVEKEVKNVITALAKTCHYWQDHMSLAKQEQIAHLLARMEREEPLVQPGLWQGAPPQEFEELEAQMANTIFKATGLERSGPRYTGWLGFDCRSVSAAILMMRAVLTCNVLSRREGTAVFVPINPTTDPHGERSARALVDAHAFALGRHSGSTPGDRT